jgi:hypothetical protein
MVTSRRARTYTFAIVGSILFILYRLTHYHASSTSSTSRASSSSSSPPPTDLDELDDDAPSIDYLNTDGSRPFYRPQTSVPGFTVVDYLYLLDGVMYFARGAGHQRMDKDDVLTGEGWVEKGSDGESESWWHTVKGKGIGGPAADDTKVRVVGGTTVSTRVFWARILRSRKAKLTQCSLLAI